MATIDKRKNYYMVIDTETFGPIEKPYVFDVGFVITDKKGFIYEKKSFGVAEYWENEIEKVKTAFYFPMNKDKYTEDIQSGRMVIKPFFEIRKIVYEMAQQYGVKAIVAHNMPFDYKALTNTAKRLSNGKRKNFFDPATPRFCTWALSQQLVMNRSSYEKFCDMKKGRKTAKLKQPKMTAEVIYQFISGKNDFKERHTGVDDAIIESQILSYIFRQKQKTVWTQMPR